MRLNTRYCRILLIKTSSSNLYVRLSLARNLESWKVFTWKVKNGVSHINFDFQLQKKLSNFARSFSNSARLFPTYTETFQHRTFQVKTTQLLVLFNCSFQLYTASITPRYVGKIELTLESRALTVQAGRHSLTI